MPYIQQLCRSNVFFLSSSPSTSNLNFITRAKNQPGAETRRVREVVRHQRSCQRILSHSIVALSFRCFHFNFEGNNGPREFLSLRVVVKNKTKQKQKHKSRKTKGSSFRLTAAAAHCVRVYRFGWRMQIGSADSPRG